MDINAELFKKHYKAVEQKLKEISELKYCPKKYKQDFSFIRVSENKIEIIINHYDWYDSEEIPNEFLTMSLEEIQEMFDKKYGEYERAIERKEKVLKEREERKQYEALKAKFEK